MTLQRYLDDNDGFQKEIKFAITCLKDFWREFTHAGSLCNSEKFFITGGIIPLLISHAKQCSPIDLNVQRFYDFIGYKSDIDIWCVEKDKYAYDELMRPINEKYKRYFLKKDDGYGSMISEGKTDNSYNFDLTTKVKTHSVYPCHNIQFIHAIRGEPKEVTNKFDFIHVKPFFLPASGKLFITPSQLFAIGNRLLVPTEHWTEWNTKSMDRRRKWAYRGWTFKTAEAIDTIPEGARSFSRRGFFG